MSEHDELTLLNKRNIAALHEGLKQFEAMRAADAKRVEQLMATVTMQSQQIQKLQVDVAVLRATGMGHGPTGGN